MSSYGINTLRPRQDGRHFADDIFTCIFFNENCRISIKFSLKYVRKGPIDNNPALFQIMAWCRSGDKPLSEPMMISLPTHMCVTRPQWVNRPQWVEYLPYILPHIPELNIHHVHLYFLQCLWSVWDPCYIKLKIKLVFIVIVINQKYMCIFLVQRQMWLCLLNVCFVSVTITAFNTLRQRQNGHHFLDDIFKWILLIYMNFDYNFTETCS